MGEAGGKVVQLSWPWSHTANSKMKEGTDKVIIKKAGTELRSMNPSQYGWGARKCKDASVAQNGHQIPPKVQGGKPMVYGKKNVLNPWFVAYGGLEEGQQMDWDRAWNSEKISPKDANQPGVETEIWEGNKKTMRVKKEVGN